MGFINHLTSLGGPTLYRLGRKRMNWSDGKDRNWQCGWPASTSPGFATQTAHQALENFQGKLKKGLLPGFDLLSMPDASNVETSYGALSNETGVAIQRPLWSRQTGSLQNMSANIAARWLQTEKFSWVLVSESSVVSESFRSLLQGRGDSLMFGLLFLGALY